jgi:imidazolonepropionase
MTPADSRSVVEDANNTETLLVVNCSQLVTCAGPNRPRVRGEMQDLKVVPDGAMLVRNGLIEALGQRQEIEPHAPDAATIVDAGGHVVLPGFVDAHTHLVFAGDRAAEFEMRCAGKTYQEISASGGGIRSTVRSTRAASKNELLKIAQKHASWFLRGGTTTIEAKSGYGLTTDDECKILKTVREVGESTPLRCVPTFLGAHEIPDEFRGRPAQYVELIIQEMLPRVTAASLAEYCDVFCEPNIFDLALTEKILIAASERGLGLRMHVDQFSNFGGAAIAARLRVSTADHLEHTDAHSIGLLTDAKVQPVLLPGSVYAIGSHHYPSARAMIDAGLGVVLATDFNPGSSPTTSMAMVLSLACIQMKMTPAEAIIASTINAACSLNRGHTIGSLDVGKVADFVIHDASDYREIAYYFGMQVPRRVFCQGRELRHTQLAPVTEKLERLPTG